MKSVNTVIVGTLLALGLAGNAAAAPSHYSSERGSVKLHKVQKSSHHKAKKVAVKRHVKQATKRSVGKAIVKRVVAKQVAKRIAKKKSHARVHHVRSGDTLYRIAARYNTSVSKLVKLNQLWGKKASNLRVGMRIRIA